MSAAGCLPLSVWTTGTGLNINLKLDPEEGAFLRGQYKDIIPGYYSDKVHWNSINADGEVPDDLLRDLLDKSWSLVMA